MNTKLLFGALVFSALSVNAQVSTLNETFNTFTPGPGAFPSNGWTTVLPTATGNPGPLMMVIVDGANRFLQSYSGGNMNSPSYLISPQIVAPTGDKTLTFKARKNTTSAPGMIQAGLVSNPADMSTFVALGAPTMLTGDTFQTESVVVPSSSSTYLAIKLTGHVAPHTALEFDDFQYLPTGTLGTSEPLKSAQEIKFALNNENTALQFVSKSEIKKIQIYSASGTKITEEKPKNHQSDISTLQSGVYYIIIEGNEGTVVKSKFIKK
ncbi:hypothetical protein CHRY9390_00089 [Chryseobacterium aquaeductus]|uniref:Secretion system C-terminal sorting domain-containing protein n=1 Tax=Chryseobacterium aquaeductus TaxID=2675056 RepID=A0A9N8MKA8_9FLAO|nr:T9SS type A sorting domain-containing protein [Chryseobacterium aquaeductus]CAA7329452.1 hypothetical protein CHRY9390_00089 [Chryseobacterium potabilaquae]CAD7796974.1 hypothetical protein CHRY9390_00089 [Chryseobacterium aquaeductus]